MGLEILRKIFLLWTFLLKQSNPSIDTPKFENELQNFPNHHVTKYYDTSTSYDEFLCCIQHPALKE